MNRNNERHFNQIPEMKASRTRFNRDQTILTTFDSGKLIPSYVDEVLPGDTFNVNTAAIIRMSTPKYPVMDDAFIDFYYFYCPNRILWDNFKYFMGEVEATPWMPKKEYETRRSCGLTMQMSTKASVLSITWRTCLAIVMNFLT